MTGVSLDSTSLLSGTQLQAVSILSPTVVGGTAASLVHIMTNGSGAVLGYTQESVAVTFATNGIFSYTVPTGVNSLRVQTWGAAGGGGGGGGSSAQGGESGGGGEYAEEPAFPCSPGDILTITVGAGGTGGDTGSGGADGTATQVSDPNSGVTVTANPGLAGVNSIGGAGGSGSTNTIHFDGGNGNDASGNNGGAGGGSSASPTGEGNQGDESDSSTGASGAVAPTGGGNGGNGGNVGTNAVNGSGPGGGGGGAGFSSAKVLSNVYEPDGGTYSYIGNSAEDFPNALRNHDGEMWQGGQNNVFGRQYSYISLPWQRIQNDLAGATVRSVALFIHNLGTFLSSGMIVQLGYSSRDSFGKTGDTGIGTAVQDWHINRNQAMSHNVGLAGNIGVALQSGAAKSLIFGPPNQATGFLNYFGNFDSGASGGTVPKLTVFFFIGSTAPVKGGNGGDGQVIITSAASSVPTFQLGISSISATDPFGNQLSPGFTGPALTLTNTSTPPATTPTSSVVAANTAGTITVTNTQGFTGTMAQNDTDNTLHSTTAAVTSLAAISNQWVIPAGDAQVGTIYRLTAWGDVHTPASGNQALFFTLMGYAVPLVTAGAAVASVFQANNASYEWMVTAVMQITATGASTGLANGWMSGSIALFNAPGTAGTPANATVNAGPIAGASSGSGVNTAGGGTLFLAGGFSNVETGQTVRCFGSIIERLGP
jgi:hypothetical protein